MISRFVAGAALASTVLAGSLVLTTAGAQAAPGFATGNVNLRAGPSTQYPAITVVPNGARVEIHGCLRDATWCDVSYARARGWVSNAYLQVMQRGARVPLRAWRGPVITFDVGNYWGRHYRNRPFYGQRDRWGRYHREFGWERPGRRAPSFGEWRDRRDGPPVRGGPVGGPRGGAGPGTAPGIDVTPRPPSSPAIPRLPQ